MACHLVPRFHLGRNKVTSLKMNVKINNSRSGGHEMEVAGTGACSRPNGIPWVDKGGVAYRVTVTP